MGLEQKLSGNKKPQLPCRLLWKHENILELGESSQLYTLLLNLREIVSYRRYSACTWNRIHASLAQTTQHQVCSLNKLRASKFEISHSLSNIISRSIVFPLEKPDPVIYGTLCMIMYVYCAEIYSYTHPIAVKAKF